jgi:glutamate-1-semialdehyde aminotransferase
MTSNAEMFKVYDVEGREYLDFVLGSGPRARS